MHVGGIASFYIEPSSQKELVEVIKYCQKHNTKYYIIGNGTNVIFKDSGYSGVIICTKKIKNISIKKDIVCAEMGAYLYTLNNYLIKSCLSGMEWSYGIPGTIGGAVCMNAGAYGGQMKDVVLKVKIFDGKRTRFLYNNELNFGYRDSIILQKNYVVLKVWLRLKPKTKNYVFELCKEYFLKRKTSQPLEYYNSGSIFKKCGEISSGKLIDNLGLKGAKIGGAEISTLHANFIINNGNATCQNILDLISFIKLEVKQKSGQDLQTEVIIVGD